MKSGLLFPFAMGHFANDLAPTGMYIIIPAFGTAMGLSPSEIGLLFMIHNLGSSLTYVPAGLVADHVANRGVLLAATFFWVGSGYFLASFADSFTAFAMLIALAAVGDAAWHPIATGVLTQMHKARRAYALGMHSIGGHLAEVVALPAAGLALMIWDWRTALQLLIIPTFAYGCFFVFVARRVPHHVTSRPTRADFADIWRTWTTGSGPRVIALFTVYNMGLFAMITMTPLFLRANFDFDWLTTAMAMALMMTIGAVAQPWMGKLSDRVGRRPLIISGNALAVCGAFTAWMSGSLVLTLAGLGLAMTALVAIRPVLQASAIDHAGGREGTSMGLTFAFMDGFAATAALLAGLAGERDLANAFLLASAFSLVAVILALALPKARPAIQKD